jgi:hypothetical protein
MASMNRAVSRVLLVSPRRDTVAPRDPNAPRVRRYRLARVQLNPVTSSGGGSLRRPKAETRISRAERLAQLGRMHD